MGINSRLKCFERALSWRVRKVDEVGGTVEREGCDVRGRQDVVNTHPAFWRSSERAIVLAMML